MVDCFWCEKTEFYQQSDLITNLENWIPGGIAVLKEEERQEDIPEYTPGDKIYKLFNHDRVRVRGNQEEFVIKILKVKKE